jgi:hypothetical protein
MPGSRLGLTWLVWVAMGALMLVVAGCGVVAPAVPTATSAPTSTLKPEIEPLDLVILYTSHTEGIAESTVRGGA